MKIIYNINYIIINPLQNNGNHPISTAYRKTNLKKKESNMWDLWYNIKCADLHIIGVPEKEEREKGIKNVFEEIMDENFPNLKKETDLQLQDA